MTVTWAGWYVTSDSFCSMSATLNVRMANCWRIWILRNLPSARKVNSQKFQNFPKMFMSFNFTSIGPRMGVNTRSNNLLHVCFKIYFINRLTNLLNLLNKPADLPNYVNQQEQNQERDTISKITVLSVTSWMVYFWYLHNGCTLLCTCRCVHVVESWPIRRLFVLSAIFFVALCCPLAEMNGAPSEENGETWRNLFRFQHQH